MSRAIVERNCKRPSLSRCAMSSWRERDFAPVGRQKHRLAHPASIPDSGRDRFVQEDGRVPTRAYGAELVVGRVGVLAYQQYPTGGPVR
jgi:hypothetical protein